MKSLHILFAVLILGAPLCHGQTPAPTPNIADLQARVAKGDAEAELELGRAYHLAQGVPEDYAKAADLYRKAAAQGNAKAMYNLGYMYHHAQGVLKDDAIAEQWFQKSADAGLPAAYLQVGLAHLKGTGGTKLDSKEAAKWLLLAAQQNSQPQDRAMAANALGNLYIYGNGVPQDGQQAVFWLTEAADLGDGTAMGNLGRLYLEGRLVKGDPILTYMWTKLGALRASPLAGHLYEELMANKHFTPEQIVEGDKRVADYVAKHPRTGVNAKAQVPFVPDPEAMPIPKAQVSATGSTNAPAATPPAKAN